GRRERDHEVRVDGSLPGADFLPESLPGERLLEAKAEPGQDAFEHRQRELGLHGLGDETRRDLEERSPVEVPETHATTGLPEVEGDARAGGEAPRERGERRLD